MKKLFLLKSTVCILLAVALFSCGPDGNGNGNKQPVITPIEVNASNDLYGLITDNTGAPVENVVVSDGYQCVATDEKGIYQMKRNQDAVHVFYSLPSEYKVTLSTGKYPEFYSTISNVYDTYRKDFTLEKGEKETKFTLIGVGDPQVNSTDHVNRFIKETMAAVKVTAQQATTPCYALMLGDITNEKPALYSSIVGAMYASGVTYWATIGNHDKFKQTDASLPRTADVFMETFGPVNYSFNRGDVHFVCLDNIRFSDGSTFGSGLLDEQIEWLEEDLSYVDKNKMVIVFHHIPIRNSSSANYLRLFELLDGYANVHFMSGHSHYHENFINTSARGGIYEHVHGTACGAWWNSTLAVDGVPNGYTVYDINGNDIVNWYYKASLHDKSYQARMHKGSDEFKGQGLTVYKYSSIAASINGDTVIANVFNSDPAWEVYLYENGADKGKMSAIIGWDMWTLGYHVGVLGKSPSSYETLCRHLYYKQRTPGVPDSQIKVVIKDRFGNIYEQAEFTSQDDFSEAVAPIYN